MNRARSASGMALVVAALIGPLLPIAAVATTPVGVEDFGFESFSADYYLDRDDSGHSMTRVVEEIVAVFPDFDQNRGIIRAIPLRDGEVPLEPEIVSVRDESGGEVYFERGDYNGFAELALGTDEYVHGRQTYVIEYTLRNTIRTFADSGEDEFYWDVNGTGWAQEFGEVSARVHLSAELAEAATGRASCYLGEFGGTTACGIVSSDDQRLHEASGGPLGQYSTLTIAIGFEGGTITQPRLPRESWAVVVAPWVLAGLALLALLGAILVRVAVWRDADGRPTIIAEYEPPDSLHVLLAANIIERTDRAFPAQLVDFAVRRMINIIDNDPGSAVGASRQRFVLEFLSSQGANVHELKVLTTLFGNSPAAGKRVNPGKISARTGAALYSLTASTARLAVSEGYRAEPGGRVAPKTLRRVALLSLLGFIPILVWAIGNDVLDAGWLVPLFWLTLGIAISVPIVLIRPKALTAKGSETRDHLVGVREYLTIAERDRIRMLQSPAGAERLATRGLDANDPEAVVRLYERLLPYAVLWGVEEQWTEQLAARYPQGTPDWLAAGSMDASLFTSFAQASTSSIRPVVSTSSGSSWSSSGSSSFSSGSSGGGFSGGGGGGGGGGGR